MDPEDGRRYTLVAFTVIGACWVVLIIYISWGQLAPFFGSFVNGLKRGQWQALDWLWEFFFWLGLAMPGIILYTISRHLLRGMER